MNRMPDFSDGTMGQRHGTWMAACRHPILAVAIHVGKGLGFAALTVHPNLS